MGQPMKSSDGRQHTAKNCWCGYKGLNLFAKKDKPAGVFSR